MTDLQALADGVRAYALSLPEAVEEFPWGDRVAKVRKKIFVFLGRPDQPDQDFQIAVKLPESADAVLSLPFVTPTGYGLGKAGWVTVELRAQDAPPLEMLEQWVDESWRAIAPKKLVKERAQNRTQP
jgi:predicted DNA-binding protein (MmcQ/YjbR family)